MIFLIEYHRRRGKIVTFKRFRDADRAAAAEARLDLELSRRGASTPTEIVLLEAETEAAIRRTHRRYFQTVRQMIEAST